MSHNFNPFAAMAAYGQGSFAQTNGQQAHRQMAMAQPQQQQQQQTPLQHQQMAIMQQQQMQQQQQQQQVSTITKHNNNTQSNNEQRAVAQPVDALVVSTDSPLCACASVRVRLFVVLRHRSRCS